MILLTKRWNIMKKLLLISIFIVGIVFITGCIDESYGDVSSPSESKTSGALLNPTKLVDGYSSINYKTTAISEMESYVIGPNYESLTAPRNSALYEGEIPAGKKRIMTSFDLENRDENITIGVTIHESDSGYEYKQFFSELEEQTKINYAELEAELKHGIYSTRNSIGDHTLEISTKNNIGYPEMYYIIFSLNNKLVSIQAMPSYGTKVSAEKLDEEALKVAKAIKDKID